MNKLLGFTCLLLFLAGCGYTTRGFIYEEKEIIIHPVKNEIDISSSARIASGHVNFPILIENKLTTDLVTKFNIDGYLC